MKGDEGVRVSERRAIGWKGRLAARCNARYAMLLLAPIPLVYLVFGIYWSSQFLLQADFTGYYTAATLVKRGLGAQLYDLDLQRQVQAELIYPHRFAVGDLLPFQYPPFAVLPFLPVASLPLRQAYYLWAALNLLFFGAALATLFRSTPGLRANRDTRILLWVASFSFLPFLSGWMLGQLSFLVLLCFAVGMHLLHRRRDAAAGFVLAGIALKPHLLLVVPLLLASRGRWRALGGLALGVGFLASLSMLLVGPWDVPQFVGANLNIAGWLPHTLNLNWYGLFSGVLSGRQEAILAATLASDGLTLALLWRAWRGEWNPGSPLFSLKLALLMLASMLVSPHLYGHDLVLLIPVAFYVADYLLSVGAQGRTLAVARAVTVALFLAALLDSYPVLELPVRPVFLAMLVAGWAIFKAARGAEAGAGASESVFDSV